MDAATANPYAAIQKRLDAIRSNPKLTPIDRTNLLAMQERRLRNLLGVCSRYQADTEKAAQAQGISHVVAEMRMEAGAGLRESLLLEEAVDAKTLDEAGLLSREDIDRLTDEGLRDAVVGELAEEYREYQHRRGRGGRWTKMFKAFPKAAPVFHTLAPTTDYAAFTRALHANTRAWNLADHTDEEYSHSKVFLTADGLTGGVVSEDGEAENVFNNNGKGAGASALVTQIENGATHLNAFDGFLPGYYARFGFEEVARMKFDPEQAPDGWQDEWDHPDVVWMAYKGGDRATIRQRVSEAWPVSGFGELKQTERYEADWDLAKRLAREAAVD